MTDSNAQLPAEKLAWAPPRLEPLGTVDDVRGGGVQGGLDGIFQPTQPATS